MGQTEPIAQTTNDYVDSLEAALIDLLDGQSFWHEIQNDTGLSVERCKEIEDLFKEVSARYDRKHNLSSYYKKM